MKSEIVSQNFNFFAYFLFHFLGYFRFFFLLFFPEIFGMEFVHKPVSIFIIFFFFEKEQTSKIAQRELTQGETWMVEYTSKDGLVWHSQSNRSQLLQSQSLILARTGLRKLLPR